MQTLIFGYAIDTQIENIPTVVYDLDGRPHGRELIEAFANTRTFRRRRPRVRRGIVPPRADFGPGQGRAAHSARITPTG